MQGKSHVDLLIVTSEPFPVGMAATNRILSYAVPLAEHKKVKVIITQPTELPTNLRNKVPVGSVSKLPYKYIHNEILWPEQGTKLLKVKIILRSYFLLWKEIKKTKPPSVLLVSNNLLLIWLLYFYSKKLNFNLFQEKTEKPPVVKKNSNVLYKQIYLSSYKLLDGMVVMTNELSNYFKNLNQLNIYQLPMTVDIQRFKFSPRLYSENQTNYIFVYTGGGNLERDGIKNIIDALVEIRKRYLNFELHIYGPINRNDEYTKKLLSIVVICEAENYVKFKGSVPSTDIPSILSNADCLIMAPSANFRSGGFPTKLGEYLATGRPVICTSVSEIPLYLNKDNSLLIPPNDCDELIKAIETVLTCYSSVEKKGERGREVAKKNFSVTPHIPQLIKFLKIPE